ncbi:MAG: phage tail tape measure protein [Lachnotalea sp.]
MAGASLRVGANTSEFNSQMKSMLTQMKLVTSEYKVNAAQAKALGSQADLLKAKQTELTAKINLQSDAIKLQTTHITDQKQKLTDLQDKEQKLKDKIVELSEAYKESVKATGKDSEESKKLKAQLDETRETHAKAEKAVKSQEEAIAKNTIKVNENQAALVQNQTELRNTEEELENAEKKWTVFGHEIQTAGEDMDGTGKKTLSLGDIIKANLISDVIISGVKALAKTVKDLAAAAIGVGMDFESGMSQVAATMGITTEEIAKGSEEYDKLEQAAKDAGSTTQFSATEAAEALNYLALAGYDADKSVETLPTVLNLAAAGGMDLATASDMVTDSMSALGDMAGSTESFVDKMAKTSQKSNTSVSQLGEAILTVGGTAKSLSGGVDEMNTVLGIFADNGVKGAEGGTALRNVILSLTAPTDTAKAKMKDLGIEVFDAEGNMRPLNETFNDLNGILGDMTAGEQTEALNEIFNKTDLKSVNALLANSGERFDELSGYIGSADGAAADMAATMNDNLKGKFTIIKSSLEGVGIAAYEKFKEPLSNAAENVIATIGTLSSDLSDGTLSGAMDKIAEGFGNLVEKASEIIVTVLPKVIEGLGWVMDNGNTIYSILLSIGAGFAVFKVAALIGTVVSAVKGLTAAEVAFNIIQKLVNLTMAANPIIFVATLVAILVAGIITFVATNENARTAVTKVWNGVKETIGKVVGSIVTFFTQTIPNALNSVINFVKSNWQGLLLLLVNPFAGAFKLLYDNCEGFRNTVDNLVTNIKTGFGNVVTFFRELPGKIWNAILGAVDNIITWGEDMKAAAVEGVTNLITNVVLFFQELPYKMGYIIGLALGKIIQWGIDLYNWVTVEIPAFIKQIITFMKELPGKIWNAIVAAITNVATWVNNMRITAVTGVTNLVTNVITFMSELPSKIWNAIVQAVTNVYTWGENMKANAASAATSLISNVFTTLSQMPNKVKNAIQDAISQVATWGTNLAKKGTSAASSLVSAVVNGISGLPGKMVEIGKNIVNGVWQGICNAKDTFTSNVKSFFSGIVDGVKSTLGIHSPSRVFRDQVGRYMAEGVSVGFTNEMDNVNDEMKDSLNGLTTKVVADINPVAAVKQTAKIVSLDKTVNTQKITDNSNVTVIVYTTNTTTLDKKVIAQEVKKEVVKGITKDQNNKDKCKGAA